MSIEFSKSEKDTLHDQIKNYFEQELDDNIGDLGAMLLVEFITEKMGPLFYNRGLQDAQKILEQKLEDIRDAIYEIEVPSQFDK